MKLIKEIYENLGSTQTDLIVLELEEIHSALSSLKEGTGDLPEGMDIEQQFDLAVARLEAARRGMQLLKKLGKFYIYDKQKFAQDPEAFETYKKGKETLKKNTSRVMSNLQTAGKLVDDIVDHIQNEFNKSQDTINQGSGGEFAGRAAEPSSRIPGNNTPTPKPSWKDRFTGLFK